MNKYHKLIRKARDYYDLSPRSNQIYHGRTQNLEKFFEECGVTGCPHWSEVELPDELVHRLATESGIHETHSIKKIGRGCVQVQYTGGTTYLHNDSGDLYSSGPEKMRWAIMMSDHEPGHVFWLNGVYREWKTGDIISWRPTIDQHFTANLSLTPRYTIVIQGNVTVKSEETV